MSTVNVITRVEAPERRRRIFSKKIAFQTQSQRVQKQDRLPTWERIIDNGHVKSGGGLLGPSRIYLFTFLLLLLFSVGDARSGQHEKKKVLCGRVTRLLLLQEIELAFRLQSGR